MTISDLHKLLKLNEQLVREALAGDHSRRRLQELVFHKIEVLKSLVSAYKAEKAAEVELRPRKVTTAELYFKKKPNEVLVVDSQYKKKQVAKTMTIEEVVHEYEKFLS